MFLYDNVRFIGDVEFLKISGNSYSPLLDYSIIRLIFG